MGKTRKKLVYIIAFCSEAVKLEPTRVAHAWKKANERTSVYRLLPESLGHVVARSWLSLGKKSIRREALPFDAKYLGQILSSGDVIPAEFYCR